MARKSTPNANQHPESEQVPANAPAVGSDTDSVQISRTGPEYRSRCGGALRLARETQGFSTQEVAHQLRMSAKQIEAMEADQFTKLPEATIVKGFIRNYAKLLKIPAQPLLDAYLVIVPDKQQHSLTLMPASSMKLVSDHQKPGSKRYLFVLLAAFVAISVWFFYQNFIQKPNPLSPTVDLVEPAVEALPEIALPIAERNSQAAAPAAVAPADTSAAGVTQAPAVTADNTSTSPAAEVPAPASPSANATTADSSAVNAPAKLELNASQETWVSVADAAGKEIYNKILFPGNRETIEVQRPFNIVVGNAHGATLMIDGENVDLAPHTRVNVARMRVD